MIIIIAAKCFNTTCFCFLSFICTYATADFTKTDREIETLTVTASQSQSAAINAQQISVDQQLPGSRADAAELLKGIRGIQTDSRSNYAQDTRITARGFGARSAFGVRGIKLQIDGIPLSMPDGQGQFSGVMLEGVTRVSVLTGPLASLYGNAAGGVINLHTSAPGDNRISLSTTQDEDELTRHYLLGQWQQNKVGARIQATAMDAQGNRPHASAERNQLNAQFYYDFDSDIKLQYRFDKEDAPLLEDPLGLTQAQWQADLYQVNTAAEFFNTRKSIDHYQQSLSLRADNEDGAWQIALWQGERDIQQYLALRGDAISSSGGVVDLARDFRGANGNYDWQFTLGEQEFNFTLGSEWAKMLDTRRGFVNNNGTAADLRRNEENTATNADNYALLQWQLTDDWQWLLGSRRSRVSLRVEDLLIVPGQNADDSGEKKFTHQSTVLSSRYQINTNLSLHAAISRGFETPTLTEIIYTNNDQGFNKNLASAKNHQQEIGLDYETGKLKVALAAFQITTTDEILVDQSVNGRTTFVNAAETDRQGIELSTDMQWSSQLLTRIALNYIDATYSKGILDSLSLPGVAKQNHALQLTWLPLQNDLLKGDLSVTRRSQVPTNDNNLIYAPAFTLVDIALSGKLPIADSFTTDWWIKLSNITDESYVGSVIVNQANGRAFESGSGRNLEAGVKISYVF